MSKYCSVVALAAAIIAVTLQAAVSSAAMPEATPTWEADYGTALKATRADDRPLLIVLEQPEKDAEVTQVTFNKEIVSEKEAALLEPYQLCRVDASTDYGQKVAKAFNATTFPHTAIIDKTGSVVIFAKAGKQAPAEWFQTLETYKDGNRTDAFLAASSSESSQVIFHKPYTASYGGSNCANGQCSTGNCPNGQCTTGSCPTGNCPNRQ